MSIYKQNNRWTADVSVKGKRIARLCGFKTKRDAQSWHDKIRLQYVNLPTIPNPDVKLSKLIEVFREKRMIPGRLSTSTIQRYQQDIEKLLVKFGSRKVSDIELWHLEDYQQELLKTMSATSVNHITDMLRTILNYSSKRNAIVHKPWVLEKLKEQDHRNSIDFRWWDNKDDISAFLDSAKSHKYYGMYLLALETGMRLAEVVGLVKDNIDFPFSQIYVERQYVAKDKTFTLPKWKIKRYLDFDPNSHLKEVLRAQVQKSKHDKLVFHSDNLNPVNQKHLADKYMRSIIKRAGVPRITFHDLRHTFACWYMIELADIYSLQAIMGHKSIRTTEDRYLRFSKNHKRKSLGLSERINTGCFGENIVMIQGGKS